MNIGVAYINLRWEFIQENKKVKKKHAFDQESDQKKKRTITVKKKERKHALGQRKVKKKITIKKKRRKEMENANKN